MSTPTRRITFLIDEDARFEESNGEARPLTVAEYRKDPYLGCPQHWRARSKQIKPATGRRPAVVGCSVCGNTKYELIPYDEYRAYYGNPKRHVYLRAVCDEECPVCHAWRVVGSLSIDFMDTEKHSRRRTRVSCLDTRAKFPGNC